MDEPHTASARALAQSDPELAVWWATRAECVSALSRLARDNVLDAVGLQQARTLLLALADSWLEIRPRDPLRSLAERLLAVHPLRTADAFQLAAALEWCRNDPAGSSFVTLDRRLQEAALKEGFTTLP